MRIVSIGELLWDVIGGREFLGGAPLNFSVSAQGLGNEVVFLSAVGEDKRGKLALESVEALGLSPKWIQVILGEDTGTAVVRTDEAGNATFVIRRPAAFDFLDVEDASDLANLCPDWIYFGTLAQANPQNEETLHRLIAAMPQAQCFYDMNLREGHWNLGLVNRLSKFASIIKLNEAEAEILFREGAEQFSLEAFCRYWSRMHGTKMIVITLAERGCAIWSNETLRTFPGFLVEVVDTVGAGDAFSAAFLHRLQLGWPMEKTASFANALGAIVASRAGATPMWTMEECIQLMQSKAGLTLENI